MFIIAPTTFEILCKPLGEIVGEQKQSLFLQSLQASSGVAQEMRSPKCDKYCAGKEESMRASSRGVSTGVVGPRLP